MSSAAVDEARALFAPAAEPSMHAEDAAAAAAGHSRSASPASSTHDDDSSRGARHTIRSRAGSRPTAAPAAATRYAMPAYATEDANTGPKGVIADARAYERAWRARRKSPARRQAL
ncbi:MAG: hypothetical protein M1826_000774, partial [Phylliscum demangeonii]